MPKKPYSIINDSQTLKSAQTMHGHQIPVYDDGYGEIYLFRDSIGIQGIVRAEDFETAHSICEDEFYPEADMTIEEIRKEYNFKREHIKIIKPFDGPERPNRYSNFQYSDY